MLTKEQIQENKVEFETLLNSLTRVTPAEIQELINWFNNTDFFIAPASTKYHEACDGGLCEHSLRVYSNLKKLYDTFNFKIPAEDSLIVAALFHDISKVNFYKKEIRNKKDEQGNWYSYESFTYKEPNERFFVGNHESTSAYITSTLLPLHTDEYAAILNHHGGMGWDSAKAGAPEIFEKYPLAQFLYYADMIDAYDTTIR